MEMRPAGGRADPIYLRRIRIVPAAAGLISEIHDEQFKVKCIELSRFLSY